MKLLMLLLTMTLAACGAKNLGGGTPSSLNNGVLTPMLALPNSANVGINQNQTFKVTGGVGTYTFVLLSGSGQVGFYSGIYQAPGAATSATILISDQAGHTSTVSVCVAGCPAGSGGTTVTPTNCSAVLAGPYVAYYDASYTDPTYVSSPSRGLVYSKTVNLGDPTSCANWCGQNGLGTCEWSPGSGTAALCIGWPKGQSVTAYSSTWATFAGVCQ